MNIKEIRGELTQMQFAEKIGVSVRTVQDWEQGRSVPDKYGRHIILEKYGVDVHEEKENTFSS